MKIINLWLSEYVDYSLLKEPNSSSLINILVNSNLLSKIRVNKNGQFLSPLHWVNKDDLNAYGKNKIKWGNDTKTTVAEAISNSIHYKDSNEYSLAIERLLFHARRGCMDALMFASSCSKSMDSEFRIRIIVGGEYKVTELIALIWWISVCSIFFPSNSVKFLFVSRNNNVRFYKSAHELLSKMSSVYFLDSIVSLNSGSDIMKSHDEVILWWTGSLPNANLWEKFIDDKSGKKGLQVLRAAHSDRIGDGNMSTSFIEISSGNGDTHISLSMIYNKANSIIKQILHNEAHKKDVFESYSNGVIEYFSGIVPEYFCSQLYDVVAKIEIEMKGIKISSFFSINAPLLESIALHMYVSRQGILPFLLPHSFTTSYEYPSSTYINSFTFIKSDLMLASAHWDKGSMGKEFVIPSVHNKHNGFSLRRQILNKFIYIRKIILKHDSRKLFIESASRLKELILREYNSFIYLSRLNKKKIRIGVILNFEHYEFSIGLDFSELFNGIQEMSDIIHNELGSEACLNLRAKPGYTNVNLLRKYIKNDNSSFLISPNKKTLLDFGYSCDVVLYLQGTSAILELMMKGIPCISLGETTGIAKLDQEYINIPQKIVPVLSLSSVIGKLQGKSNWLNELGEKQSEWVLQQMKVFTQPIER